MAIDFPNSPTNGQTLVANGITYKYDSTIDAWLIDSYTSNDYVVPAFLQANTARDHANAAFLAANNAVTDFSPAFLQANIAYAQANSAYDKANNAGGTIPIFSDTESAARYIVFGTSTSGNLTNANVSTTLTYNPGTNRLAVGGTGTPSNTLHVFGTANISSTLKSAGIYDSSDRLLLIKDSTGTVVWGN